VKICSIYGAGFFYIPGTDTCIKIGGWVRAEYALGETGNSHTQFFSGGGGLNNKINSSDSRFRARTVISLDVRTQTEYGTVRAYNRFGFTASSTDTATGVLYTERAFIQIAGFTFGKTQSYFDFVGGAVCYGCGYGGHLSQYGAGGTLVFAYSATLGNGLTATIALEDQTQRRVAIWDASNDAQNVLGVGTFPGPIAQGPDASNIGSTTLLGVPVGDHAAHSVPDIVGSLRVDQAWGSAQISAAAHQLRGGYYGNNASGAGANGTPFVGPSDTFGFAVDAGVSVNLPWAKGDRFYIEGAYTEGAPAYAGWSGSVQGGYANFQRYNGANVAAAWAFDSIFGNLAATGPTGHQLTTAWVIGAGIEHYWTPALRSSVSANYIATSYNSTARTLFCASPQSPIRTLGGVAPTGVAALAGCNPDFNVWNVGTRTIWNPVPNLDVGLEVMYTKLETKHDPGLVRFQGGGGGRPLGLYAPSSEAVISGLFRIQRNFWP
jgi:Porin subfamily